MSTATILQLTQAVGGLTGGEQLEGVQAGGSVRLSAGQIAALAPQVTPTGPITAIVATPNAGANNNFNAGGEFGFAVGFLDLTPAAPCNITGLLAGTDGQIVIITNRTSQQVTLNALNAGSLAANQFRMAQDAILTQYNGRSFKYSASLGLWVAI